MFLEKLSEREKEVFLDLVKATAKVNGVVEDAEKDMISAYCREMNIDVFKIYDEKNVDEAAAYFSESSSKVKNIVVVELLILCSADGERDAEEKLFVAEVAEKMGVPGETYEILKKDVKDYLSLKKTMKKHIKGKE